jgi:hypothetical protein
MSNEFFNILRDETQRIELGAAVTWQLAVENMELSPALSQAVRTSIIVRRADGPILSRNQLSMHEVRLPEVIDPALECRAA